MKFRETPRGLGGREACLNLGEVIHETRGAQVAGAELPTNAIHELAKNNMLLHDVGKVFQRFNLKIDIT